MPTTRVVAVPGCRKKSVLASGGCIRVFMTIPIRVPTRAVSIFASMLDSFRCAILVPMLIGALLPIFASMLDSFRCPIFVPTLIGALLSMFVSMFILSVLRLKAERPQSGHRKCAEGK
jgi:uncharacterized membrane protein